MSRSTAIILGLIIAIFAIGAHNVYGETFQQLVEFPIPDNISYQERLCGIETITDTIFEFTCSWRFTATEVKEWYDEIITRYGLDNLPEDEILEEMEEQIITDTFLKEPAELVRFKADLVRFEEKAPTSNADKEYFELLKELATCQRGTGAAKGIQTEARFPVSTTELSTNLEDLKSLDYTGSFVILKKAIEECDAQKGTLEPITLGVEAFNKGVFADTIPPSHTEMAHYNEEYWANIPTHKDYALDERDFLQENETAFDRMCASEFVNDSFKRMQKCPPKEYTASAPRSDGFIHKESVPISKYSQYQSDGGETMFEELQQKQLRDLEKSLRNP